MSAIAVIGEAVRARGFGLAGALVYETTGTADVVRAWEQLPPTVAVLIVTPDAALALRTRIASERSPFVVVMPP
jgi:vacuolar-type H+-ATPase subunit F/Vma7